MKIDRYQELFERSTDANLIIVDEKFVDCNAATIKMLGYKDKQELLNTHPSQLSPERQPNGQLSYVKANKMMSIAFEKGSHRFEWDHKRANGEVFPVEVLLTSIPEDNKRSLHVVWRDITDRKKADASLRESRDQLEAIFNSTKDGILVAEVQSKIFLTGNNSICEMLGYSIGELTKLKVDDIHPEKDLTQIINNFGKQARVEIDLTTDVLVSRKDGTVFFADISTSLVIIDDKTCLIGIFRDVTTRKEIEEKVRHTQKLEAIGILAGGIAHDFNNILSAMLGYSELAINELPAGSEGHKDLSQVLKAGKRATELIKQILTFSQQSTSNFAPVKIQSGIQEVLQLLRATLPTTIEIKQEIDNSCGEMMADATQIHQVLMNLCTNAFHAMEEKGGTLVVRLQEVNLTGNNKPVIHALPPGKYLKLEVSDNGSGIDKKIINHIFDPYYTTKPKGKGSGLGLAVAYGIVKDHGGTIKVESKLGHGATFKVLLPVIDRVDNNNKPDMKSPNKPPKGTERILFVDDEKPMAVLGQKMLGTLGYTVRYETNSNAALETFKDNPQDFDLVITDQTMPDLSGSELSKELMKIRPDLPIILYSGYSSVISERETRNLGIKAFVMKPMDLLKLAQTVRKVLDKEWNSGQHF
jgi:PAS domain S-box-containing protein